jgi:hypothetical protein
MSNQDILVPADLVFYAFRYCLGRRTYAVDDFISWAKSNSRSIPPKDKILMAKEIEDATQFKTDFIDNQWNELARQLRQEVEVAVNQEE